MQEPRRTWRKAHAWFHRPSLTQNPPLSNPCPARERMRFVLSNGPTSAVKPADVRGGRCALLPEAGEDPRGRTRGEYQEKTKRTPKHLASNRLAPGQQVACSPLSPLYPAHSAIPDFQAFIGLLGHALLLLGYGVVTTIRASSCLPPLDCCRSCCPGSAMVRMKH
jgi:hypothetical protein